MCITQDAFEKSIHLVKYANYKVLEISILVCPFFFLKFHCRGKVKVREGMPGKT